MGRSAKSPSPLNLQVSGASKLRCAGYRLLSNVGTFNPRPSHGCHAHSLRDTIPAGELLFYTWKRFSTQITVATDTT
jgi:hypothetical protein